MTFLALIKLVCELALLVRGILVGLVLFVFRIFVRAGRFYFSELFARAERGAKVLYRCLNWFGDLLCLCAGKFGANLAALIRRHVFGVRVAGVEIADLNKKQAFVEFDSPALRSAKWGAEFCSETLLSILSFGWSSREQGGRRPIVNKPVERTHNGLAVCCGRATSQHTAMPLCAAHR